MLLPMLNIVSFCISGVLAEAHFMYSVKHGCFLHFHDFALSRYVAQVYSEPFFSNGASCPCYYCYGFCFYIPHVLCFYCKVFMF